MFTILLKIGSWNIDYVLDRWQKGEGGGGGGGVYMKGVQQNVGVCPVLGHCRWTYIVAPINIIFSPFYTSWCVYSFPRGGCPVGFWNFAWSECQVCTDMGARTYIGTIFFMQSVTRKIFAKYGCKDLFLYAIYATTKNHKNKKSKTQNNTNQQLPN